MANPAFTQRIWKPGQSGNPCGAIGEWQRCRALCRENSADAAAEIIRLYKESDDDRVRFMSAQWVYARAWGEKEPAFDPNAEPPPALFDAGKLTPQQREQVRAALALLATTAVTPDQQAIEANSAAVAPGDDA